MTVSLKEIPPVVALPLPGGGRVEISVVDDTIWVSDYSSADVCNFTLRVPRGKLEGADNARAGVHELFKKRALNGTTAQKASSAAARNAAYRAALTKMAEAYAVEPPSKAGYWFIDPTINPHGGPVVVLDP
jgi:hypothetical protein